jgi:hypothetical protein
MTQLSLFKVFITTAMAWVLANPTSVSAQIAASESVLTYHNNVRRTGVYDHETRLTPAGLAEKRPTFARFERLCIRKVDGQIAAQPLYVKGVNIGGTLKNVLYVVTRNDKIYAFDADNINSDDPKQGSAWANPIALKHTIPGTNRSLNAGPLKGMDDGMRCLQTHGPVGITSTPVIDPSSQIMYLVARFGPQPQDADYGNTAYYFLISLDIRTGQELRRTQIGTPESLGTNPCPETGFNACAELNRPGLLLLNNVIYIAFGAAVCDNAHSRGWVFAYSVPDMTQLDAYNTSPQSWGAGIWQSGAGLAADPARQLIYAFTGNNGDADWIAAHQTGESPNRDDVYHPSRTELGQSLLKLRLGPDRKFSCDHKVGPYCVPEHFTAGNWYRLDTGYHSPSERQQHGSPTQRGDTDIGSGGPVVLSNGWVVGGGKQGVIYVSDPTDMKHAKQGFQAFFNTWHPGLRTTCTASDPSTQPDCEIALNDYDLGQAYGPNIHANPTVWERPGSAFGYLYAMPEKDYLRAFRVLKTGRVVEQAEMTTDPAHHAPEPALPLGFNRLRSPDHMPGAATSLSSNGDRNGILWTSLSSKDATNTIEAGVLMAFDALNLNLLWYDDDPNVYFAKFVPPTIAGGKVFRATFGDNDPGCLWSAGVGRSCGSVVIYGMRRILFRPVPPGVPTHR